MTYWINLSIIFIIVAFLLFLIILRIIQQKQNLKEIQLKDDRERFKLAQVQAFIQKRVREITTKNLYADLSGIEELERRKRRRKELEDALEKCNTGDLSSKIYVREYIYSLLAEEFGYDEDNINWTIPFHEVNQMTAHEKFEILLYLYIKKHGHKALGVIIEEFHLVDEKLEGGYRIEDNDIHNIYQKVGKKLSFEDKLRIIAQIIYSRYKGFGVIDEIRDMSIDGVSGGVSGISKTLTKYHSHEAMVLNLHDQGNTGLNSVWIMYKAKNIHLSFLAFEHESELRRVVTNLYKHGRPGQLSEMKPYIINDLHDGSRVTVVRPKFAESWAFFVRKKFDAGAVELTDLFKQKNREFVIELLQYLIRGERTCAITGAQGSGKTTLLIAIVKYIRRVFNIRTQETHFELALRTCYPNRNILGFQETDTVSGQDGLDLAKKTDGDVSIIGEVATPPVAAWMIQTAKVASRFILFTHHGKTLTDTVDDLGHSLLKAGNFSNEIKAEEEVANVLEFDIHMDKKKNVASEERYIERISECIPITYENDQQVDDLLKNARSTDTKMDVLIRLATTYFHQQTQRKRFIERVILEYRDGEYVPVSPISEKRQQEIMKNLLPDERKAFKEFIAKYWGDANEC